jgi:hypothetical protein
MKRSIAAGLLTLAMMIAASPSYAQPGWYSNIDTGFLGGIDNQQARLQARINAGIQTGRLTPREAARLQSEMARIAQMEARLRATNGRLNFHERRMLNDRLDRLSFRINQSLNDFDRRFAGRPGPWY